MKRRMRKNDEAQMTNDEGSSNAEMTKMLHAGFAIRISSFLRHWTFVIRHFRPQLPKPHKTRD